jgi:hypothetical protein
MPPRPFALPCRRLLAGLILSLLCTALPAAGAPPAPAAIAPAAPAVLPGRGLAQHDFFYAGEAKTRDMYIVRGGKIDWAYHEPAGQGEISDAVRLSNGNILFAHQFGVTLITPERKVLWQYAAPPQCEIHTAQPIGLEHVIFIQNGPEPKLFVANVATGRMEKELPLPVANPGKTHGQFRHARLTPAGTYLVAHMDLGKIVEYDENGRTVWSADAPGVWSALRLANGNTLIGGKTMRELNPGGETVWEFTAADVPGYKFGSNQLALRLPNGNTLLNQWINQWNGAIDPATAPVQALEVTPAKQVVWALRSWVEPAALGPATTIQLLDEPDAPEAVHFGAIR